MRPGKNLSIALLIGVMLIWGSTFVVTKAVLTELPPLLFAFLRFIVASLALLSMAVCRAGLILPRPAPWWTIVWMSFTGILLYYLGFNVALHYTSASQAALVQSSVPIVTAILAVVFLREPLSPKRMAGIALAIIGVALIFWRATAGEDAPAPIAGNLMMFASVLAWGIYTVLAKRVAGIHPLTLMTYVTVLGTVMLGMAAAVENGGVFPHAISAGSWGAIIYLGLFASALAFVLYSNALRILDASQVATFVNLVPVVGVLSGVALLGETLSSTAMLGGALVFVGVWISTH